MSRQHLSDETLDGIMFGFALQSRLATNPEARARNEAYHASVAREMARAREMTREEIVRTLKAHFPAYLEEVLMKQDLTILRSRYAHTFCWDKDAAWRDSFERQNS